MRKFLFLTILAVIIILTATSVYAAPPDEPPGLDKAIAAKEAHNPQLLSTPGVVGTAVGFSENDIPVIMVFTERAGVARIPASLDGISVAVKVTGNFYALKPPPGKGGGKGGNKQLKTTDKWPLPVPIGVSTGNASECSAGTIGARVIDSQGNVFALSNNHVYALENSASTGDDILQPGLYDTKCRFRGNNNIGSLYDWEDLNFGGTINDINYIDAAIASSSTSWLDNATPPNGYGIPSSTIEPATLESTVQKYGRTTGLTTGLVYAIDYDGFIGYSSGSAYFENQILILSTTKPFSKAGDSGSLIVTVGGLNPVGLLFAGDTSGTWTIANPIAPVLGRFGVTIDGS